MTETTCTVCAKDLTEPLQSVDSEATQIFCPDCGTPFPMTQGDFLDQESDALFLTSNSVLFRVAAMRNEGRHEEADEAMETNQRIRQERVARGEPVEGYRPIAEHPQSQPSTWPMDAPIRERQARVSPFASHSNLVAIITGGTIGAAFGFLLTTELVFTLGLIVIPLILLAIIASSVITVLLTGKGHGTVVGLSFAWVSTAMALVLLSRDFGVSPTELFSPAAMVYLLILFAITGLVGIVMGAIVGIFTGKLE